MKVSGQTRKKGQTSSNTNGKGEVDPLIKINYARVLTIEERDLKWHGYERLPQMMTFSNTSSSILISGRWSKRKPFITGGPLGGSYVFSQIHFHLPSEHEIDGERFPLEMHAVHYKSTYSTQDKAMLEKDGTLVIVYLFQLSEIGSSFLHEIIRLMPQLKVVNARITVDPKPLEKILIPFNSNYLLYWGSIFATQSSYMLQWIICLSQLPVSVQQLKDLQQVLYFEKSNWLVAKRLPPEENKIFHIIQYENIRPHVEEMIYHATSVGKKSVSNIALFDSKELGGAMSPLRNVNMAASSASSYQDEINVGTNVGSSEASLARDSIWGESTTTQHSISPSLIAQSSFERKSDDGSMQDGSINIEPIEPVESFEPMEPVESFEPIKPVVKLVEPVRPVKPVEPVEPMDPAKPVEPVKQVEPVKPIEPVKPVEPIKPIEPVKPVVPIKPVKPVESVESAEPVEEHTTTIQDHTNLDKEYEIQVEETTSDASDEVKPIKVFMVSNTNSENPMQQRVKTPDDRRPSIYGSADQDKFPAKRNSSQQSGLSAGSVGKRSSQQSGFSAGSVGKRISQQSGLSTGSAGKHFPQQETIPAGKRSSLQEASTLKKKSSQQDAHVSRRNSSQEPPSNKKFSSQVPVPVRRHSSVEPPSVRKRPSVQDALAAARKSSQQEASTIGRKSSLEQTPSIIIKSPIMVKAPLPIKQTSVERMPPAGKKPSLEQTFPSVVKSPTTKNFPISKKSSLEKTPSVIIKSPVGKTSLPGKKTSLERTPPVGVRPPTPKTPPNKKPSQEKMSTTGSKLPVAKTVPASKKSSLEQTPQAAVVKSLIVKTPPVIIKPSQEQTSLASAKSPPVKTSPASKKLSEQTPRAGIRSPPASKALSLEQTPQVGTRTPSVKRTQASKTSSLEQTPLTGVKTPPAIKKSSVEPPPPRTSIKSPPTKTFPRKSSQERTPPLSKQSSVEKSLSARRNSSEDKSPTPPKKSSPTESFSRRNSKETNRRVSFTMEDEGKPEDGTYRMGSDSKARSVDEEMFIGPLRRRNTRLVSQATDHFQDINTIEAQQVFSPQVSIDYQEQSEFRISGRDKISKGNVGRFDSQNNEAIKRVVLIDGKQRDKYDNDEKYFIGYKKDIWGSLHNKISYKEATDVQDRMERLSVLVPQQYIQTMTMKIGYRRVIDMGEGIVTSQKISSAGLHFVCDRIEKDIVTGKKILVGKFEELKAEKSDQEPTALLEVEESYIYVSPMKDYICNLINRDEYSSGSDESFKPNEEMSIPSFDQEFFISSISEFDETQLEASKIPDSLYKESSDALLHKYSKKRVAKISVDFNINPEREKHRSNEDYELPTAVRAFKARYIEIPQVNKTVEPTKNDESSFNNKNEVRDSTVSETISIKYERSKSEEQKERRDSSPAVKNYKVVYIPCLDYFVPTKL